MGTEAAAHPAAQKTPTPRAVTCYCGAPCALRPSKWGWFYGCTRRPCDGLVGVHPTSGRPLGTPASKAVRGLRRAVHLQLDPAWERYAVTAGITRNRARTAAYRWMKRALGLDRPYHTGELDAEGCWRALEVLAAMNPADPFPADPTAPDP